MAKVAVISLAVILIATFLLSNQSVEATGGYRKPPFNGSIFGKRNSGGGMGPSSEGYVGGVTSGGKLASLCEIACDTCSALYFEAAAR